MEGCLVTKHHLLFQVKKLDNAISIKRLYVNHTYKQREKELKAKWAEPT